MSYQSYLRSVQGHHSGKSISPSPSTNRKPSGQLPSAPSAPLTPTSIHNSVTQSTPGSSANAITPVSRASTNASPAPPSTTTAASQSQPQSQSTPSTSTTPTLTPLEPSQIDAALRACLALQSTATTHHNKRPFAALLLGPDNTTPLLTHYSISHYQHAESELARLSALHFSPAYLSACTLVSTWEPCAMCSGTIYWTGIGRVLYAASEKSLKDLTGGNNEENMTMSLPCRHVFDAGQRAIEVIGPVTGWEERVVEESARWWRDHRSDGADNNGTTTTTTGMTPAESVRSMKSNGVGGGGGAGRSSSVRSASIATTWTGEQSGYTDVDGEYKADLDIDWMR